MQHKLDFIDIFNSRRKKIEEYKFYLTPIFMTRVQVKCNAFFYFRNIIKEDNWCRIDST